VQAELKGDASRAAPRSASAVVLFLVNHAIEITKRVVRRFKTNRDHGLHATVAEEIVREFYGDLIGSIIWGMMVKDAGDHFGNHGLGTRLIDVFAANPQIDLVVVGHSAGSIWATEFMTARAANGGKTPLDLVFLAPAVRIKKFAAMLVGASETIRHFRLFAMQDDLERADVLLGKGKGFIYPSSLLYLVSGLFEGDGEDGLCDAPLLGMARFISGPTPWLTEQDEIDALATVRNFLEKEPNRVVLAESDAGAGLNCRSVSHGGFDNDVNTLASVSTFFNRT
jgi:hypothetical protein